MLPLQFGLERCLEQPPPVLEHGRFGLLMNQASLDAEYRFSCDVLARRFPGQLTALFSPQHGLWGEQQANMIESPHSVYQPLDVPIYSLYSETRQPQPDWLHPLDCLVVDLQDVGTRVYTFAWTVSLCLQACVEADIPAVILDRPNPIGPRCEGPLLEPGWESFVGRAALPLRHGLTMGELACWVNQELNIGATIDVVTMQGWQGQLWPETGRHWLPPSPNLPRFESTLVYPGQVLLEGTNFSEGRGTTRPFETCGAPFVDPFQLASALSAHGLAGVQFLPTRFRPTFDKWNGQDCGGVLLEVTDAATFEPVLTTVTLLATVAQLWPDQLTWLPPPYEYETEKMPIDILFGNDQLRQLLDRRSPLELEALRSLIAFDAGQWQGRVTESRLYGYDKLG